MKTAFEASEHARARSLVDLLGEDRISLSSADPALVARWRSVRRRLNFKSNQFATLPDTPDRAALAAGLRKEIEDLLAEDAEIESVIRSQNPSYREVVEPNIISLDEVQKKLLSPNDLLLEYSLGETRSFVWIISQHRARVAQLPARGQIEREARSLITLMGEIEERKKDSRKEVAFRLALQTLARSIQLSFDDGSWPARVVIIPDGILNRVPFAALPVRTGQRSIDQRDPLGLVSEVVEVPSASVLRTLGDRQKSAHTLPTSAAAFLDPVFDDLDSRVRNHDATFSQSSSVRRQPVGLPLARLVFSEPEIEEIERSVPADRRWIVSGFQATKSALLNGRIHNYSLVLSVDPCIRR